MSILLRRRLSAMATGVKSSPFSKAVFDAMRKLYPEDLADKSFDNTGLLLEAPLNLSANLKNKVLLTIDLTSAVAQEAIDKKASVVIAYHPIIFRGLKQLNLANSQQTSLLRLAQEGISVYSPHTAVDAAQGGNADWMADIITASVTDDAMASRTHTAGDSLDTFGSYTIHRFPRRVNRLVSLNTCLHTRTMVNPNPNYDSAGHGRIVYFERPRALSDILLTMTVYFGFPRAFAVACAYGEPASGLDISAVGICAGSGGSILGPLDDIDLLVTGEMSHHEILAAVESGKSVILLNHSNSERGYLEAVMKDKLQAAVEEEWTQRREMYQSAIGQQRSEGALNQLFEDSSVEVAVSQKDEDPLQSVVLNVG